MERLNFSNSFLIAACLHGLAIFVLSPRHVPAERPPLTMLHVKIGTSFGNAEHAHATDKKTLLAATPHATIPSTPPLPAPLAKLAPAAGKHLPMPPPDIPIEKPVNIASDPTNDQVVFEEQNSAVNTESPKIVRPLVPLPASLPPMLPEPPAAEQQMASIGSPLGDSSQKNAENMVRYEQLLTSWIKKFKQYPKEAREKNQEGTAVLYIVIDRAGNILHYGLTQKTGYTSLDDAALAMAKKAIAVPSVPENYPGDNEIGFQIVVNFSVEDTN